MAIGLAGLMGYQAPAQLPKFPYFAPDLHRTFWQRWHMTLGSWFMDYLYIPLGGSRGTAWP